MLGDSSCLKPHFLYAIECGKIMTLTDYTPLGKFTLLIIIYLEVWLSLYSYRIEN
jgi:hypothetical protein